MIQIDSTAWTAVVFGSGIACGMIGTFLVMLWYTVRQNG